MHLNGTKDKGNCSTVTWILECTLYEPLFMLLMNTFEVIKTDACFLRPCTAIQKINHFSFMQKQKPQVFQSQEIGNYDDEEENQ